MAEVGFWMWAAFTVTNTIQAEMYRIFGKEGYPTKYIDKLEDMGC